MVVGFGLASLWDSRNWSFDPELAQYAAPELFEQGFADQRADIYALASIAFELLTGRPPFVAKTVEELVQLKTTARVPRLNNTEGGLIPRAVEEVLSTALCHERHARFTSARSFVEELRLSAGFKTSLDLDWDVQRARVVSDLFDVVARNVIDTRPTARALVLPRSQAQTIRERPRSDPPSEVLRPSQPPLRPSKPPVPLTQSFPPAAPKKGSYAFVWALLLVFIALGGFALLLSSLN